MGSWLAIVNADMAQLIAAAGMKVVRAQSLIVLHLVKIYICIRNENNLIGRGFSITRVVYFPLLC